MPSYFESLHGDQGGRENPGFYPPLLFRFPLGVFVVWSRFNVRCIPLDLENILHTQNVSVRCIQNFLRAFEKKFSSKTRKFTEYSEIRQCFRNLVFKNMLESHIPFNKTFYIGRTVTIQSALYSYGLGEHFTYPECKRAMHRKFS